jgi:hypothetical protein
MKLFLKILIYSIPVILLAYLLYQNTKPTLVLNYDLNNKSAMFPALTPWNRISDVMSDQFGEYREIKNYPINFDIRLPRQFDSVQVDLQYSYPPDEEFRLGFAKDVNKTDYQTVTIKNQNNDAVANFSTTFDIKNIPTPFNKLRWQFFNDSLDTSSLLKVRVIKLTFIGQSLSLGDVFQKFLNKIGL